MINPEQAINQATHELIELGIFNTYTSVEVWKQYLWMIYTLGTYSPNQKKEKKKPIVQLSSHGKFIRTFESCRQAEIILGTALNAVSMVVRGERNHTKGFRFMALSDYEKLHNNGKYD